MSRLAPLSEDALDEDTMAMLEMAKSSMGFTPNDVLVMARNPALLKAGAALVGAVYGQGTLDPGLKRLIGYINSTAAGCQYCRAHTAHGAHNQGIEKVKIDAAWTYETSDLFTDAERAALRVAQGAGVSPNAVTNAQFDDLKNYYSEDEIVEIVGVISMFGFLNRWNSTLATEIENEPAQFIQS